MKTLYLDFSKAEPIDREMYICTYFNEQKNKPKQAPFVINIQGTYIKLDSLLCLVPKKHKKEVFDWIAEININPIAVGPTMFPPFDFRWDRSIINGNTN